MKKTFLMLALISFSAISFAGGHGSNSSHTSNGSNGSYFKITFSDTELSADTFSFHNPTGTGTTDNTTSGNYIIMTSIDDDEDITAGVSTACMRDGEGSGKRAGRRPKGWCVCDLQKWNALIQGEVVHVI